MTPESVTSAPAPGDSQALNHLGCLRVSGNDRVSFLQGQVTSDIAGLQGGTGGLTSHCNRQGRVFATALAVPTDDAIILVMPAEQVEDLRKRLAMFVFRARVTLDNATDALPLTAAWQAPTDGPGDAIWRTASLPDGRLAVRYPGTQARWLMIGGASGEPDAAGRWRFEDISAGLGQVFAATREEFLPQALNLDALGGISFEKGCYVGQEIIARLHFRGTVKRRMRLLFAAAGEPAVPGSGVQSADKTVGKVVDSASDGQRTAILAVCPVATPADGLRLESGAELRAGDLPYGLPAS